MVVIRLARIGSTHRPKYRITVADQRRHATKRFIEVLGTFNPSPRGEEKKLDINVERVNEWISKGAQPSDRVKSLLKQAQA